MFERHSSNVVPRQSRRSRALPFHAILGLVLTALGAGVGAPACSDGDQTGTTSTGEAPCEAVKVDTRCEEACSPDKCVESNTCSGNRCVLNCASHLDCIVGEQSCLPAEEDGTKAQILACQYHGRAPVGASCPFGGECAPAGVCPDGKRCALELYTQCGGNGLACARDEAVCNGDPNCSVGKCPDGTACTVLTCEAAQCRQVVMGACPDGRACFTAGYPQCSDGSTCTKDWAACGNLPDCNIGACKDGARCTVPGCGPEQCNPLGCVTTGAGDADAYCAMRDCDSDADCGGGFYCGIVRDPHEICGSSPKKGNNNLCGTTKEPCIAEADFKANGASYFEGSMCLMRRSCLRRDPCSPCETDLDCSLVPGTSCKQAGPDKRCLAACAKNADCNIGFECTDGTCMPRFAGGCKGTGQFCEPCQNDEDCATKGTPGSVACLELDGLTHERACIDLDFAKTCTTDDDCPAGPSGVHAMCVDEGWGAGPGDDLYHRCYLPGHRDNTGYPQTITCW